MSLKISQAWAWGASKLQRFSPTADVYLPNGKAPVAGQIFAQPDLAATWRKVGHEGRAAFYAGDIRDRILEVLSKNGGFLEASDFKPVQAEWVAPISASYRGHRILELPPNGQGIVVLMALRILEKFDMQKSFETDPAAASHLVLEALKLAFADANRAVGDPRFSDIPVEKLLSDSFIHERQALIQPGRAIDNPVAGRIYGDTTYLTVMDKDRNAVSLITSISDVFGSGIIVRHRCDPAQPQRRFCDGRGPSECCRPRQARAAHNPTRHDAQYRRLPTPQLRLHGREYAAAGPGANPSQPH